MPRFQRYEVENIYTHTLLPLLSDNNADALIDALYARLNQSRDHANKQLAIASMIIDEFADEGGNVKIAQILSTLATFIHGTLVHYAKRSGVSEAKKYYLEFHNQLNSTISRTLREMELQQREVNRALKNMTQTEALNTLFPKELGK